MSILRKINVVFNWFKLDLRAFFMSLAALPKYFFDRNMYCRLSDNIDWPLKHYPVLLDHNAESASLGEYFWQDLFVAKQIIDLNPQRHVDVGSRIDGFVAHMACVRRIEVFDIRPLNVHIDNVDFVQWDITNPIEKYIGSADCVSCLHTLEHIGLGRYGDELDPDGWRNGLNSLAGLVSPGGVLWLSVPIGFQRVEFNAHRVYAPKTINDQAAEFGLELECFYYSDGGDLKESLDVIADMARFTSVKYLLGIFRFRKRWYV